jgi:Predicted glycosyltransferases
MSAVTGACLMVKKALYKKVNGLDEEMFAIAFNDVDFCLKLREIEYLNVMTPFAEGIHYESLTRGYEDGSVKEERFEKEKANLRNKYRQLFKEGDPYYNPHLTLKFENYGIE